MIRGVLFLVVILAIVAVVMSLMRRSRRRPLDEMPGPVVTEVPPPALPAPDETDAAGPAFSVDTVLHKLNELAFSRSLTTSVAGHEEIIGAVTKALETAANEPRYAPRRPMLL